MPEDLVCKFPRCISVGSCRDPWRINGSARMKGRGRAGEEVGEDRCSLYLIPFTFMYLSSFLSLSLSLSRKRIVDAAGCSRALRPSIRSVRPNRGPPNKRSFRSRAARLERTSKKRRDRGVPSLSASGTKLAQWTCIPSSVAPIRLSLDRLPIVLARAAQLRQPEKDRDQKRGCTVDSSVEEASFDSILSPFLSLFFVFVPFILVFVFVELSSKTGKVRSQRSHGCLEARTLFGIRIGTGSSR